MNIRQSQLDNPETAAIAWGYFRRLMGWMALAAAVASAAGLWAVDHFTGPVSWVLALMVVVGIFLTVMLGAALMGLVFLSNGTGHDGVIEDPFSDLT